MTRMSVNLKGVIELRVTSKILGAITTREVKEKEGSRMPCMTLLPTPMPVWSQ